MSGWLNVDWSGAASNGAFFQALNLVEAHPFPDDAFEYGYAEDFLEHLSQADSIIFLAEVHRTLKPGGVIRLSFPGLEGVLVRHYPKVATLPQGSYFNSIKGKHEAFTIWDHVHFYSRAELSLVAEHLGFRATRFCEHGESDHESLRGIDTRQDQRELNTYAELVK